MGDLDTPEGDVVKDLLRAKELASSIVAFLRRMVACAVQEKAESDCAQKIERARITAHWFYPQEDNKLER